MSTPAYLPLFGSDYLADTRHLTTEEHGAYLLLMMAAWRQDDCGLPLDDKKLSRITGLSTRKWLAIKDTILDFWMVENGRIYQARLRKERSFAAQKSESNRKSASARWAKQVTENIDDGSCERMSERNAPQPQPHNEEPNGSSPPIFPHDVCDTELLAAEAQAAAEARALERAAASNPKPRKSKSPSAAVDRPDDVSEQIWSDFLRHRAKLGADVSATVIAAFRREASDVGWPLERAISESILRGWRGFKSAWVKSDERSGSNFKGTAANWNEGDGYDRALNRLDDAIAARRSGDPASAAQAT